jgi:L-threonylcarbamoyladenylate synthase
MAIRAPKHAVALALLRAVGRPIAAPSANLSMQLSPTRAEHVLKGLEGRIDLVLDAGPCPLGIESTVVDLTHTPARVLRPGSLTLDQLAAVVPGVTLGPRSVKGPRTSPGMDPKHYAPRAHLLLATRDELGVTVDRAEKPVGVLTRARPLGRDGTHERTLPDEAAAYGAALFDALHQLDDLQCATVVVEMAPDAPSWAAVRDRLERASAS